MAAQEPINQQQTVPVEDVPSPKVPPQNFQGPAKQPVPQKSPPPQVISQQPPNFPTTSATGRVGRGRGRKVLKILLILLGVIIVGAGGFFAFKILSGGGLPIETTAPTEVTWWGLWEDENVVGPLMAEYEQANPNVKINYIKQSHIDYRERLINSLARGEGPDIFRFHNSWVPMLRSELDPMPSDVMSASQFAQSYYKVAASDLTSGPSIVGIPLEIDGLGLYVNEDMFSQAGLSYPETWPEFERAAKQLTTVVNGKLEVGGAAIGRTENVDHWPEIIAMMILQNRGKLENPTDELSRDALVYFTSYSSVFNVWNETLPASTIAFAGGKVAMMFAPSWRAFEIAAQNPDLNFRIIPVPQLPKENPTEPDITYASYWVEGVWARSKKKNEAWKFLKFLSSRDSLTKLFESASRVRMFGEPYPRVDMASLLESNKYVGAYASAAGSARSWYLYARTHDGDTGINSQINKYYENAINAINSGTRAENVLPTLSQGISQVLAQYGIASQASR